MVWTSGELLLEQDLIDSAEKKGDDFSSFEDEYGKPIGRLKPVNPVLVQYDENNPNSIDDHTEDLENFLSGLEATRGIVDEGQLVSLLQEIINKMLKNSSSGKKYLEELKKKGFSKPRVYLMEKGLNADAFVTADGSIFLSLALLKKCPYLDHVAEVEAHELNHLINGTYQARVKNNQTRAFTISWLHELGADFTKKLVEAAEYNPEEGGKALRFITDGVNTRGSIHTATEGRVAIKLGELYLDDSDLSTQEPTPFPTQLLEAYNIRPTNEELLFELLKDKSKVKQLLDCLPKLHKKDFVLFLNNAQSYFFDQKQPISDYIDKQVANLTIDREILRRSNDAGLDDKLSILMLFGCGVSQRQLYLLNSVQDALGLIEIASDSRVAKRAFNKASQEMLSDDTAVTVEESIAKILDQLKYGLTPPGSYLEGGLTATEDELFLLLTFLKKSKSDVLTMAGIFFQYICKACASENGSISDEAKLANLLARFQAEIGSLTRLDFSKFNKNLSLGASRVNYPITSNSLILERMGSDLVSETNDDENKFLNYFDQLIAEDLNPTRFSDVRTKLQSRLREVAVLVDSTGYSQEDRVSLMQKLHQIIDQSDLAFPNLGARGFLSGKYKYFEHTERDRLPTDADVDDAEANLLFVFQLKLLVLFAIFDKDSDDFYRELANLTEPMEPFFDTLDITQKVNFISPLLGLKLIPSQTRNPNENRDIPFQWYSGHDQYSTTIYTQTSVSNGARFAELPLIKQTLAELSNSSWGVESWQEFIQKADEWFDNLHLYYHLASEKNGHGSYNKKVKPAIFGDTTIQVMLCLPARNSFEKLLDKPVKTQDLPHFLRFVSYYLPNSIYRDDVVRKAHRQYLLNDEIPLKEKIDHYFNNITQIDPGLAVLLAANMEDVLGEFRAFRERGGTAKAAILQQGLEGNLAYLGQADYGTSLFMEYEAKNQILATLDASRSKEMSQQLAELWCKAVFGQAVKRGSLRFSRTTGKVEVWNLPVFKSLKDTFLQLKNMPLSQRAGLLFKLLTEQNGFFQDETQKKVLSRFIVKGLEVPAGFQSAVVHQGIQQVDSEYLQLPMIQMLSGSLFSALNFEDIDIEALLDMDLDGTFPSLGKGKTIRDMVGPDFDLSAFLGSRTDQIATYVGAASNNLTPEFIRASQQMAALETRFLNSYNKLISTEVTKKAEPAKSEQKGNRATLSAAQVAGALPIRGIQILSQVKDFEDPALTELLSSAADQNPGMNELIFRDQLLTRADKYPELKQFMVDHQLKLGKRLAAGSLFTTFEGTIEKDGKTVEVVIQQLSPNAHLFIEEYFKQSYQVLQSIIGNPDSTAKVRAEAEYAIDVLKMSREWCRRNIKDENFEAGLQHYFSLLDAFQAKTGEVIKSPNLLFIQRGQGEDKEYGSRTLVKVMEKVPGRTANQIINDSTVPIEYKQKLVAKIDRFFGFQLRETVEIDGKQKSVVHSDSQLGNFIVDEEGLSGEKDQLYVIDLDMVLILDPKEAQPFSLLHGEKSSRNTIHALNSLLDLILDREKVRNPITRSIKKMNISRQVRSELQKNKVEKDSPLMVSQAVNQVLRKMGYSIPIEYQLLFRSVIEKSITKKKQQKSKITDSPVL